MLIVHQIGRRFSSCLLSTLSLSRLLTFMIQRRRNHSLFRERPGMLVLRQSGVIETEVLRAMPGTFSLRSNRRGGPSQFAAPAGAYFYAPTFA
jgi:hypothetical protein